MPELPEVETVRRQLQSEIVGQVIDRVEVGNKKKVFLGDVSLLNAKKISSVTRIAKMIIFDFGNELYLVTHLKMTGQLLFYSPQRKEAHQDILESKYTRIVMYFKNGGILQFRDVRLFGWMKLINRFELSKIKQKTGPDALNELTKKQLVSILSTSKRAIKIILMDQQKIAGIGNIYANDAVFLAKINPKTPASKVSIKKIDVLYKTIHKVLSDGVKWNGASQNHYRDIYGNKGTVQNHFYVYARAGTLCPNKCGGKIKRMNLGGRGTFYCPLCQK